MAFARSHRAIVAAAGAIGLLVVGSAFVLTETASVKVVVPPQRIDTVVNLNTITIQHIDAQLTDSWQGTSSTINVAAAFASGPEDFKVTCSRCSPVTIKAGTVVRTTDGIRFATQAPVTVPPSMALPVPIKALVTGASGNQAPATVTIIENAPPNVVAFNPIATSGGVDAGTSQVIQKSDLDSAQAALTTKVTNELTAALAAKATGMTFVADAAPTLHFTSDHSVGDKTGTFTLSVDATLGARAFADSDAQPKLKAALQAQVLPGYRLVEPFQATYSMTDGTDPNHPAVSGHAIGYAVPKATPAQVADMLKGSRLSDASSRLHRSFPAATVRIATGPVSYGWLPLFASRINISLQVIPVPTSGS